MGGGQALSICLTNPDLFHYILGFSGAVGGPFLNAEAEFGEALSKPEALNSKLRLLWIACGKQDFLYQANRQFVDILKSKRVNVQFRETEGSHVWSAWRNYLNETAPILFTNIRGKKQTTQSTRENSGSKKSLTFIPISSLWKTRPGLAFQSSPRPINSSD
jgi:S-formylglutathione hydrolase FrmB